MILRIMFLKFLQKIRIQITFILPYIICVYLRINDIGHKLSWQNSIHKNFLRVNL